MNETKNKTYNTGDSLVVTELTTNPALTDLSVGEQTGSRSFAALMWVMSVPPGIDSTRRGRRRREDNGRYHRQEDSLNGCRGEG
jgi:hypothetical protein